LKLNLLSFIIIVFKVAKFVEMDERVGIFEQMEEDVGPVILINKFSVAHEEFDQFLKGWASEAEKFKEQPGFISTQLHKGIGGSGIFVNYAVWETVAHFKNAVNKVMDPNNRMSAYPPSTVASPHLFKKVAVPGICVE
jgi:quinol monooxygenase YgiN